MIPVTEVALSGRVLNAAGQGIRNSLVTVSGGDLGSPVTVQTGSFGNFVVRGLHSAQTYTVTVNSKRFTFSQPSRQVSPLGNVTDIDFTAAP